MTPVRDEVAAGFRYAHFRADANTGKLLELASFLYAAIELLRERGVIDIEELDRRKVQTTSHLVEAFTARGMGVVYQKPERDKYAFEGTARIDCESRLHLCKASCCRLRFALSRQDVEEGIVRWDFSAPYVIARGDDGYCQHHDTTNGCCSVYEQRPIPCRGYDCRADPRIWVDFERRVINPAIDEAGWPQPMPASDSEAEARR